MGKNKKNIKNMILASISIILFIIILFLINKSPLMVKISKNIRAELLDNMEDILNAKLEDLKAEKAEYMTLDDVTQEWLDAELYEYRPQIIDDLSIAGKKVILKNDEYIFKFELDENLIIISKEKSLETDIQVVYEVKSKSGNDLITLVTISDIDDGIEKIEYLNDEMILNCYGKKSISRDCFIQIGEEYKIKIITKNGEEKIETIQINDLYCRINRNLQQGIRLDNKAIKIKFGEDYTSDVIVAGENTILNKFNISMNNNTIETNRITAKIEIENVVGEIVVEATSKDASVSVNNVIIARTTTATTSVPDHSVPNGTPLYIRFVATLEGIACDSNPEIPYEITQPGTYKFKLSTIHSGKTISNTYSIKIKKYDVYYIENRSDLEEIKNDLTGSYYIINDIDLGDGDWTPIHGFNGTLNGNYHTISNLTINNIQNAGLFGYTNKEHSIKNLRMENVNVKGTEYAAGLVAQPYLGHYENIGITGTIQVTKLPSVGNCYIGSICGKSDSSGITYKNCYARTNLTSQYTTGSGGLVGDQYCRATKTIENCYWSGTINGTNGPIIYYSNYATIRNCYYNKSTYSSANANASDPSIGLTTDQFADSSNFKDWDFENVWIIKDGYPELRKFLNDDEIEELDRTNLKLIYNANGGTGSMQNGIGTTVKVKSNQFIAPDAMKFKEWNIKSDGTGTKYSEGDIIDTNTTLYAIWEDSKEWILTDNDSNGAVSVGDLLTPKYLAIRNEQFYVIKIVDDKVTLLAKKCIKTNGSGENNYFQSNDANNVQYDANTNVYANAAIKSVVNNYALKLINAGMTLEYVEKAQNQTIDTSATGIKGRLIYQSEATNLSNSYKDILYGPIRDRTGTYWTGTPSPGYSSTTGMCFVNGTDGPGSPGGIYGSSTSNQAFRVRPVIEILIYNIN